MKPDLPSLTTFFYQNIRGLRTKVLDFSKRVLVSNFDFIFLSETWLNETFFTAELFGTSYNAFRHDRDYQVLNCARGGGVLIASATSMSCSELPHSKNSAFEDVWVRTNVNEVELILCCVYFPPQTSKSAYESFITTLEYYKNRYLSSKFILMGDFNFPGIKWMAEDGYLIPECLSDDVSETFFENIYYMEFNQINKCFNDRGNLLDLVFIEDLETEVKLSHYPLGNVDLYHPPLELILNTTVTPTFDAGKSTCVYDFSKTDYQELNNFFNLVDWDAVLDFVDVNKAVCKFYEILSAGIDRYTPVRFTSSRKYPTWYSNECKRLINLKNRWYKKYQTSGLQSDYAMYSSLRQESKHLIDLCYLLFISESESLIPYNVKHFWSYIKNLKRDCGLPRSMKFDGKIVENEAEISKAFAEHFQSCYSVPTNVDTSFVSEFNASAVCNTVHYFTANEVEQKLLSLDVKKGAGPDGIPPLLLKKCSSALSNPLQKLFQLSFHSGVFPDAWKLSILFPIYKSGDKADIKNYRGISILSSIPKVLESIITDDLFFNFKHVIAAEQHGFFRGRSTTTNLAVFQHHLTTELEQGCQVDCIYTDITKAFDSIPHELVAAKLDALGVSDAYLRWIMSYLSDRLQCVRIGGCVSQLISVTSGVPQGSHIGPIIFVLFFNDVVKCLKFCKCLLYADDLKLYCSVSSIDDCVNIQKDLENLLFWCQLNHLELNIKKCRVLRFSKSSGYILFDYNLNDTPLGAVNQFNDLGVVFDQRLSFIPHIDNIVLKAFRMLGFVRRNTWHMNDTRAISALFNSYVRSLLEYNSLIWSPYHRCHIDKLERVQNKYVRYYLWKYRFPYKEISYHTRLQLAGLPTLRLRRDQAMIFFLYKLLNGLVNCEELLSCLHIRIPARRTRLIQFFEIAQHRTEYGSNDIISRMCTLYNGSYQQYDLFCSSLKIFKRDVTRGFC